VTEGQAYQVSSVAVQRRTFGVAGGRFFTGLIRSTESGYSVYRPTNVTPDLLIALNVQIL